ncbi:hypothetical protein A2U01_0087295, partial [Trifolium medium]|nr:hypothetical protein [Trifolium medium]
MLGKSADGIVPKKKSAGGMSVVVQFAKAKIFR